MNEPNESDILFPDKTITLGGEEVTVSEFKYLPGLIAAKIAQPLLAGLVTLTQTEGSFDISKLDAVIGEHADIWTRLLGLSCGKEADWVANLRDIDGTMLSLAFWEVNGPFLLRRVAFVKRFSAILSA